MLAIIDVPYSECEAPDSIRGFATSSMGSLPGVPQEPWGDM